MKNGIVIVALFALLTIAWFNGYSFGREDGRQAGIDEAYLGKIGADATPRLGCTPEGAKMKDYVCVDGILLRTSPWPEVESSGELHCKSEDIPEGAEPAEYVCIDGKTVRVNTTTSLLTLSNSLTAQGLSGGTATFPPSMQSDNSLTDLADPTPLTKWEHGWKTDNVIATRYSNPRMGFNIGFQFPKNLYNSDHPDVFAFFTKYGGNVYEGGGYPGAEMLVVFKDVTDRESADRKIKELLPELSEFMRKLR